MIFAKKSLSKTASVTPLTWIGTGQQEKLLGFAIRSIFSLTSLTIESPTGSLENLISQI